MKALEDRWVYQKQVCLVLMCILTLIILPLSFLPSFAEEAIITARYNEFEFDVRTSLSNGASTAIRVNPDFSSVTIGLRTDNSEPAELDITLPRELIDSVDNNADRPFIVLVGTQEASYEETSSSESDRRLRITIPAGEQEVEIIGTQVVPEIPLHVMGVLAAMIAVVVTIFGQHKLFQRSF